MHVFYFMYSIAVCQENVFVNQLIKGFKQLDDLHAHTHTHTLFTSSCNS